MITPKESQECLEIGLQGFSLPVSDRKSLHPSSVSNSHEQVNAVMARLKSNEAFIRWTEPLTAPLIAERAKDPLKMRVQKSAFCRGFGKKLALGAKDEKKATTAVVNQVDKLKRQFGKAENLRNATGAGIQMRPPSSRRS